MCTRKGTAGSNPALSADSFSGICDFTCATIDPSPRQPRVEVDDVAARACVTPGRRSALSFWWMEFKSLEGGSAFFVDRRSVRSDLRPWVISRRFAARHPASCLRKRERPLGRRRCAEGSWSARRSVDTNRHDYVIAYY